MEDIISMELDYEKLAEITTRGFSNYVKENINDTHSRRLTAGKTIISKNDRFVTVAVDFSLIAKTYAFKIDTQEIYDTKVLSLADFFIMQKLYKGLYS